VCVCVCNMAMKRVLPAELYFSSVALEGKKNECKVVRDEVRLFDDCKVV
jgi:hypothetical protein